MMKIKVVIVILFFFFMVGCLYNDNKPQLTAEVIAFHSEKCMCCWGWEIKIGDKIIRTESRIVGSVVGYEIEKPVPVLIVLGKKEEDCSTRFAGLDFFEIADIELIK